SVVLSSDRGTHSSVSDNADGTYSASLTSTSAGLAHVTGTVNGAAIGTPATVTFLPDSVSAGHTTVAASSGSASTDTGNTVTVTVTAKDANDNTIPNAHVTLDQGAGTSANISPSPLSGADTDASGVATFTVSDSVAQAVVFSATVSGTLVSQTAGVTFQPGAANAGHSLLSASPSSINADGTSGTSAIIVRAKDAYGNDLSTGGSTVAVATTRGSLSSVSDNGDGTYSATLTATGMSGVAHITGQLAGSAIGGTADVNLTPPVPVVTVDSGVPATQTTATTATIHFHSPNDAGN